MFEKLYMGFIFNNRNLNKFPILKYKHARKIKPVGIHDHFKKMDIKIKHRIIKQTCFLDKLISFITTALNYQLANRVRVK